MKNTGSDRKMRGKCPGFIWRSGMFLCGTFLIMLLASTNAQALWQDKTMKKVEGAAYVGTETCATCHEKELKEFELSPHARLTVDDKDGVVVQGCEICHGPGSVHSDNGGGKDNIILPRENPQICFSCHTDKKAEFMLPYRHPVLEGKMACADCHNSHGTDARPWSGTSMEHVNETCFKCHKEQQGPFIFEHEAAREGCTTCHKVHGSIHDKMLIARDNNLCFRCHTQTNFPFVGDSNHNGRFQQGTCFSAGCHTAMHGSNFDDHLRY